jgi:hypothetical protein
MPDERLESMQRGIGAPPESPAAVEAERRRLEALRHPAPDTLPPEGALGGTSDAETAGDEARMNAALRRGLPEDPSAPAAPPENFAGS